MNGEGWLFNLGAADLPGTARLRGDEMVRAGIPHDCRMLVIQDCPGLRELPPLPAGLESLNVENCPGLRELPDASRCGLQTVWINNCGGLLALDLARLPHARFVEVRNCGAVSAVMPNPGLETLRLDGLDGLVEFPALAGFGGLKTLEIARCKNLTFGPDSMVSLPSQLVRLSVVICPLLTRERMMQHLKLNGKTRVMLARYDAASRSLAIADLTDDMRNYAAQLYLDRKTPVGRKFNDFSGLVRSYLSSGN